MSCFAWSTVQEPKNIQISITQDQEKQQVFTFKNLEPSVVKTVADQFSIDQLIDQSLQL